MARRAQLFVRAHRLTALTVLLTCSTLASTAAHAHGPVVVVSDPDEPRGTVEVRVTDPEGGPVAGASITYEWRTPGPQRLDGYASGYSPGRTDATGLLLIDLPVGRWSLGARERGYLSPTVPPVTVSVTEGEVTRVQFTLTPVEVEVTDLTVWVTGPVPGREAGEPVPIEGAHVSLKHSQGEPRYYGHQSTDDKGRALLEAVAEGDYSLFVKHDLFPDRELGEYRISPGTEELTVHLDPPVGGWGPVSGRVVRDGGGVADVRVVFSSQGGGTRYSFDAVTGDDGGFAFSVVPVGEYLVTWRPQGTTSFNSATHPEQRLHPTLSIDPAGVDGLELPLPWGVHVHGPVENLGPTSSAGYYSVAVSAPDTEMRRRSVYGELQGGRYHGMYLTPGTWDVTVRARGREATRSLEVPESAAEEGGEIELPIPLPVGYTVRGMILRTGRPMEGVHVLLCPCGAGSVGRGSFRSERATGPDGRFTVLAAEAGDYDLKVKVQNVGTVHEERVTVGPGTELTIEARPASIAGRVVDAVTGEAIPGARVRFFSFASETDSYRHGVIAEDDGTFRIDPVRPGRWSFEVSASGYSLTTRRIELKPEEDDKASNDVVLELNPTAGLPLHVTMDNGDVPRRLSLRLVDPNAPVPEHLWIGLRTSTSRQTQTAGDPLVFWEDAPAGRWLLDIRTEGGGRVTREVEIGERVTPPPHEIVLPSVGALAALVPDGWRREITGFSDARFSLVDSDGEVLEIDPEYDWIFHGAFIAESLPPGRYVATVALPDGRAWTAEAEVVPGRRTEVELLPKNPDPEPARQDRAGS